MEGVLPQSTEVIVDSEDEEILLPRNTKGRVGDSSSLGGQASSIRIANSNMQEQTSNATISQPKDFSLPPIAVLPSAANDSISDTPFELPAVPKPRPKPRPVKKTLQLAEGSGSSLSISTAQDTFISTATPATSINASSSSNAEKPHLKPRPAPFSSIMDAFSPSKAPPSVDSIATASSRIQGVSMILEISDFSRDIAERAKIRSRARTSKAKVPDDDIIEISDDDEISFLPPVRPKAKPKPAKKAPTKGAKTFHADEAPVLESTPVSLPAPTSSLHLDFQLPPSDPPLPSTATVPPTSTPPDFQHLIGPAPSPLSSPVPSMNKKRKRLVKPIVSDDEASIQSGKKLAPVPSGEIMPPPSFASSSSASASLAAPVAASSSNVSVVSVKKRNTKKRKAADEEDDIYMSEGDRTKSKSRRKRDDADDDYGAKPKPKSRRKAAPKTKKLETQVEIVLDLPKQRSSSRTKSNEILPEAIPETQPEEASVAKPAEPHSVPDGDPTTSTPSVSDAAPNGKRRSIQQSGKRKGKDPDTASASAAQAPVTEDANCVVKPSNMPSFRSKGKRRALVSSDEEDDVTDAHSVSRQAAESRKRASPPDETNSQTSASSGIARNGSFKENGEPAEAPPPIRTPLPPNPGAFSRATSIVPSGKTTPMSELIRKVNSLPGSPFTAARPTHSPYLKSSRSMLKRIAPLHPNRRTPPPPLPRPPPPKKTKKDLEREEKWEQELEDSVEGWYCLPEEERAALRRAKKDTELGFDD